MKSTGELVADDFEQWHKKYFDLLLPIAKSLRDRARGFLGLDARDLVQETLLRFIERRGTPSGPRDDEAADGWLIKVMTNHFYDLLRGAMGRKKAEDDPSITRWTLGHEPASNTYERITAERFDWAIAQLPPQQRITFLLRSQQMRNQDIAKKLGVSPGTVAKRLFDAREKLDELLKPYLDEGMH